MYQMYKKMKLAWNLKESRLYISLPPLVKPLKSQVHYFECKQAPGCWDFHDLTKGGELL